MSLINDAKNKKSEAGKKGGNARWENTQPIENNSLNESPINDLSQNVIANYHSNAIAMPWQEKKRKEKKRKEKERKEKESKVHLNRPPSAPPAGRGGRR